MFKRISEQFPTGPSLWVCVFLETFVMWGVFTLVWNFLGRDAAVVLLLHFFVPAMLFWVLSFSANIVKDRVVPLRVVGDFFCCSFFVSGAFIYSFQFLIIVSVVLGYFSHDRMVSRLPQGWKTPLWGSPHKN